MEFQAYQMARNKTRTTMYWHMQVSELNAKYGKTLQNV